MVTFCLYSNSWQLKLSHFIQLQQRPPKEHFHVLPPNDRLCPRRKLFRTFLPLSFAKDLNLNGTFKAFRFLSLWNSTNNSSPAFEEHTQTLRAQKKRMKLQKKKDKSNFKSQTYRIPSDLAYSLELNLVLQIKGPAAKLALKKEVGLECKAKRVPGTRPCY